MRIILTAQLCFLLILAGTWQALILFGADPSLLPPIGKVMAYALQFMSDPEFLADLGVTAIEIGVAFAVSVPIAICTGLLVGEFYAAGGGDQSVHLSGAGDSAIGIPADLYLGVRNRIF